MVSIVDGVFGTIVFDCNNISYLHLHSVPGRSPRSKLIANSAQFYGLMGKI